MTFPTNTCRAKMNIIASTYITLRKNLFKNFKTAVAKAFMPSVYSDFVSSKGYCIYRTIRNKF